MPEDRQAARERKRREAQARKDRRVWVEDKREGGGFWYAIDIPASEHGQWKVYNNWYCRCWDCTEANRLKVNEYLGGVDDRHTAADV